MRYARGGGVVLLAGGAWFACAAALGTAGTGPPNAGYGMRKTYVVAGATRLGVVRVDSAARRIYVAAGGRIDVLNADSGAPLGDIPVAGTDDIVLAPALKRGFAASGPENSISAFDTATLKIVKVVRLPGEAPDALAFDPSTQHVFVAEGGSGEVYAFTVGLDRISSVSLKGRPGAMVSNGYGELFVAAEGGNAIHVVDTRTLKFLGDFPLHRGCQPSALALDPRGRRLFVACSDARLQIIDTDIGFTFETLPIGTGTAGEVFTFKPQGAEGWKGATFVVTTDGTLTLVRMDAFIHYSVAGRLELRTGIQSIAYDSRTHQLFVPAGSRLLVVGQ